MDKIDLPDAEWRKRLSPEQYHVLREGGTERAFTGVLYDNHDEGAYRCAACGNALFDSGTKFESGSGWPSFTGPAAKDHVTLHEDVSHGMVRTEVRCANAAAISAMSSPTGPGRKACATASTRPRSISRSGTTDGASKPALRRRALLLAAVTRRLYP